MGRISEGKSRPKDFGAKFERGPEGASLRAYCRLRQLSAHNLAFLFLSGKEDQPRPSQRALNSLSLEQRCR